MASTFVIAGDEHNIDKFLDAIDGYIGTYPNDIGMFQTIYNSDRLEFSNYLPINHHEHRSCSALIGHGDIDIWSDKLQEFVENSDLGFEVLLDDKVEMPLNLVFDDYLGDFTKATLKAVSERDASGSDQFPEWFNRAYPVMTSSMIRSELSDMSKSHLLAIHDVRSNEVRLFLDDSLHRMTYDVTDFMSLSTDDFYNVGSRSDIGSGKWSEVPSVMVGDSVYDISYDTSSGVYTLVLDMASSNDDDLGFYELPIGENNDYIPTSESHNDVSLFVDDTTRPFIDALIQQKQAAVNNSLNDDTGNLKYCNVKLNPYSVGEPSFKAYTFDEFDARFGKSPIIVFSCSGESFRPGTAQQINVLDPASEQHIVDLVKDFIDYQYDAALSRSRDIVDLYHNEMKETWHQFESFASHMGIAKPDDMLDRELANNDKSQTIDTSLLLNDEQKRYADDEIEF